MAHAKACLGAAVCLLLACGVAEAQHEGGGDHGGMMHAEPAPGPRGYHPIQEPHGWNARPGNFDRGVYQHNYQAARAFHVGPYYPPAGWGYRRWTYGQILPRAFWAPQYVLGDYWLFNLEVPPGGYEWVRDGADALLVNTTTGEILQVEYGVFA